MEAADYIVVGAGSAGCVLANRLSADPSVKVVLLEAGGWDRSVFIRMPAGMLALMKSGMVDWGYYSEPQKSLGGRKLFLPRGKVVGGSSSVNGMVYIRGDATDFDHWAQLGNRGWSYSDLLPYFMKSEAFRSGDREGHGRDGPLSVTRGGVIHPLSKAFVEAAMQAGLPYNDDFNYGDQFGVGPVDSTILNNQRCSSAAAFLHPALGRPNLKVITRALASRIILEKGTAVGIEYIQGRQRHTLRCNGEIILSGGAINSPHLLQLSGIGDPAVLGRAGIRVTHELPGVGRNLQDHPATMLKQLASQPISLLTYTKPLRAAFELARYMITNDGPVASPGGEAIAFVKTRPEVIAPDIQYFMTNIIYENNGKTIVNKHGFMFYFTLQRPESRGTIFVKSGDPRQHPAIDMNFFENPIDIQTMREAIKIGRDIAAQKAFDPYRGAEYAPGAAAKTDAQIEDYVRSHVTSNYHLSGTCKMGHDDLAVVDDRLKVRGLRGLRVADASIMPKIVSGNTNAATIMIGEKGSSLVLEDAA